MLSQPILFIATVDPDRCRKFYEKVLLLKFVADEQFALVFDTGGTPLRIQKVESQIPAKHTVLGWSVEDIQKTVENLVDRGVTFERYPQIQQDDLGVWKVPGVVKVAWFKDPDGNTLSLTEARDAA